MIWLAPPTGKATVRIGTRPARGESHAAWSKRFMNLLKDGMPFATSGSLYGHSFKAAHGSGTYFVRRFFTDSPGLAALVPEGVDYVVYSYITPIAWRSADGWVFNPEYYGVTTARHIGLIRRMLSL